jgi:flagellar basal-body rod protein FlgG
VVNTKGYPIEPAIVVPDDAIDVEINNSGEVFAKIQGQTNLTSLGQIELASFVNPAGLEALGDNMFIETEASGPATTGIPGTENFGMLQQGLLEQSNVNVVEEITNLISAQRAYEMNSNVISTSDEMMRSVTQLR